MKVWLLSLWVIAKFAITYALPVARYAKLICADGKVEVHEAVGLVEILWPVDAKGAPRVIELPFSFESTVTEVTRERQPPK